MNGQHVLVARLDNLGDVVLTGPAVRAVAARARRVTFLAGPSGAAVARLLPGVDEVVSFDAPWVSFDPPAVRGESIDRLVSRLRQLAPDRAVVFTSSHQSPLPLALLLRLARVEDIAAVSVDYPGSLLDLRDRPVDGLHEVEQALRLVERFGYPRPPGDDSRLALREPLPAWRPFADRYVVVHAGASVPARAWNARRAADTVRLLSDEGWKVAVTGGHRERRLTARIVRASGTDAADLGGRLDVPALAGVLRGADAVVAPNTGPAHLAAAVGTPIVSIFAPVVPSIRWRPYGVPTVVLGDQDVECAGCGARVCPIPGQPCLSDVTAFSVVDAVHRLTAPLASAVTEVVA
jgi:ADP-heptose:LPS heptosyltransferase